MSDVWFVYDGECPICSLGASLYRVRQQVGALHTLDARTEPNHPVMQEVNAAQLNLDEGMVIKYADQLYQGDAALHLMAKLGANTNPLTALGNGLFKSRTLSKLCYPSMKAARNIALKLKGVGQIGNLK